MAERKIVYLNHDCLQHIFQFVKPTEWQTFAKVCRLWKSAATSKDCHKLKYEACLTMREECIDDELGEKTLSSEKYMEILKFVAPQLKYAKIQRVDEDSTNWEIVVTVAFGRFHYFLNITKIEANKIVDVIVTQAENIETLKINSFDGATKRDWEQFFQTNPVTKFEYTAASDDNEKMFLNDYIFMLPMTLDRFGYAFHSQNEIIWERNEAKLLQFLDKLPRISKLKLVNVVIFSPFMATVLSKHVKSITKIHLFRQTRDYPRHFPRHFSISEITLSDLKILSVISKCTNLTKLHLCNIYLNEDACEQIAKNCQAIRCLNLWEFQLPETCLRILMSLPNLEKLTMMPYKITITEKAKSLKELLIVNTGPIFIDYDNVANALALMPSLSSLKLLNFLQGEGFSDTAARAIKRTIHSRGQNIVLYSEQYKRHGCIRHKVAEIPCQVPSSSEFAIGYQEGYFHRVEMLTKV